MKHVVRSCYRENIHEEPIDAEQFDLIQQSREVLVAALEAEDIFDNLISNYLEIETKCLGLTTQSLVRQIVGYREGNEALASINLAFVNYLSTARAYVDKIGSAAARSVQKHEQVAKAVKDLLSQQYDADFGFRFMEALRNHVQHSGSALHILDPGQRMYSTDQSKSACESFLSPLCSKDRLIQRGGFKAKVLEECPEFVNLLECARAHLRGLSRVQRAVRLLTEQSVLAAAHQIRTAQAMLAGKVSGSLDATEAVAVMENGDSKKIPMLLHWDDVRTWLVQRNPGIPDGTQTYPSGRVSTKDA